MPLRVGTNFQWPASGRTPLGIDGSGTLGDFIRSARPQTARVSMPLLCIPAAFRRDRGHCLRAKPSQWGRCCHFLPKSLLPLLPKIPCRQYRRPALAGPAPRRACVREPLHIRRLQTRQWLGYAQSRISRGQTSRPSHCDSLLLASSFNASMRCGIASSHPPRGSPLG